MKPFLRITIGYAIFGIAWILVSDRVVAAISPDIGSLSWFQSIKGGLYVLASSALIYFLSWRAYQALRTEQIKRERVFRKTIEASHHILLNYLNKMQIVTLEAERCQNFDPATLEMAREISTEAAHELDKLNEITTVTAEQIDSVVYRALHTK